MHNINIFLTYETFVGVVFIYVNNTAILFM